LRTLFQNSKFKIQKFTESNGSQIPDPKFEELSGIQAMVEKYCINKLLNVICNFFMILIKNYRESFGEDKPYSPF
jgi:hypothetical protein